MKNLMTLIVLSGLAACGTQPVATTESVSQPQILTVHNDGTMILNDRAMNKDDVIIYSDGFGGERAAVKVHVPLKTDFYRDSIRVEREEPDSGSTENQDWSSSSN